MTATAPNPHSPTAAAADSKPSHFLRQIIELDLAAGSFATRRWAGTPGDAAHHAQAPLDPAKIRTRFPPEPNGYLHIGHAKSICLNFGLARDYGGVCHLRFDDTNPEKEDTEYVLSIIDTVKWLGFEWNGQANAAPYQASDYFGFMYRAAEYLIDNGLAYVDEQSAEDMRLYRGDFNKPGTDSPFRSRSVAENLARFRAMRDGELADGSAVLRAKIDMAAANINLRDPALYRIRRATHHLTGDTWCIYPMYTFAHPIEDALENITHSICTLEFEDQRPFYDWLMDKLSHGGLINSPPPRQHEFSRLNLTYVVTSKRKLAQLVHEGHVSGWDDPRMPTLVGLRRRGYTPQSLHTFAERIGVTKSDSWIDYSTLEGCLREDLDPQAARAMVVLDPIKLVITNWAEVMEEMGQAQTGQGEVHLDDCQAPVHPHHPDRGLRHFQFGREVWIERSDFEETPPKGFFRLYPGNRVRLKYGHVVTCVGAVKDGQGKLTEVHANLVPDTKSGTPGSDSVKVKGVITWVGVSDGVPMQVRLYDRLFTEAQPDSGGKDFVALLNPHSLRTVTAMAEPSLQDAQPGQHFQFERHGYFVADRLEHQAAAGVFNQAVGLKDSWVSKA